MTLTICTWNINSVRLREESVLRLLREEAPDILCLQETKSPVDKVPLDGFRDAGYGHVIARGQKGYNGVAILSRVPIEDAGQRDFCEKGDARHVAGRLASGTVIHNFYVPAGGDVPDREANPKFGHKLDFLEEMRAWFADETPELARTAKVLLEMSDNGIKIIDRGEYPIKDVAANIATVPETLSRSFSVLSERGLIDCTRKTITILQPIELSVAAQLEPYPFNNCAPPVEP